MRNLPRQKEEEGAVAGAEAGDKTAGFPSPVKAKPPKFEAPKAPKAPKMNAPAPPKGIKAPKLDASKMKGAAPKPPVSIWPLVLTLTGLFSVGVLLILFFVLRH